MFACSFLIAVLKKYFKYCFDIKFWNGEYGCRVEHHCICMAGLVRSSGDVINRLEREMGREDFNDARPEVAYKRMCVRPTSLFTIDILI